MGSRWWGIVLVLAALGLYAVGIAHGAVLLLVVAVVFEFAGWVKLLINPSKNRGKKSR